MKGTASAKKRVAMDSGQDDPLVSSDLAMAARADTTCEEKKVLRIRLSELSDTYLRSVVAPPSRPRRLPADSACADLM